MSRAEKKGIAKAWDNPQRNTGFHAFCTSDELQQVLPDLILEHQEERKRECKELESHLVMLHAVKSAAWQNLSDEQRQRYKELSLQAKQACRLSDDP